MTQLLLADSEHGSMERYQAFLENADISISKQCRTGEEVIDSLKAKMPDAVMISLGLGGLDALETVRYLTHNHPRLPVVLLTTQGDGPFPKRLLELGARGFISRDSSAEEVERVFLAVLSGEKYISCEIAQKIALSMLPGGEHSPLDRLSEREMQIIMQLSHGESPQQISSRLALSPKTISTYKHRVKDKLSLKDTQEMYILTGKNGLG